MIEKKLRRKFFKNFALIFLKVFCWNFVKFLTQFMEELKKNCMETSNNFKEKLQRDSENISEIFEALLKICPGALQSLIRHCLL